MVHWSNILHLMIFDPFYKGWWNSDQSNYLCMNFFWKNLYLNSKSEVILYVFFAIIVWLSFDLIWIKCKYYPNNYLRVHNKGTDMIWIYFMTKCNQICGTENALNDLIFFFLYCLILSLSGFQSFKKSW